VKAANNNHPPPPAITMLLPKVSAVSALLLLVGNNHASARSSAEPQRITFESLLNTGDRIGAAAHDASKTSLLLDGLTNDGVISITDIPSFKETKRALMSHLHACIMDIDAESDKGVATQRFQDGTIRRSFATVTLPNGGGQQPIKSLEGIHELIDGHPKSVACLRFESHLRSFRNKVHHATMQFAERLSSEMGTSLPKPLLSTSNSASHDYEEITDVVYGGEHLEHFHSYQKVAGAASEETTIEFHTDQGLFIAFTPGLIVSSDPSDEPELSDGFYIQDSNGEKVLMEFNGEDDLVLMMGDGFNQFINNQLTDGQERVYVTPHALTLAAQNDSTKSRVWYGLMVLPPSDALFPSMDSTFGEARQSLIESSSNGDNIPMGIACPPNTKAVINTFRALEGAESESEEAAAAEGPKCAEDELFCWFRCQKIEDYGFTTDSCTERSLSVQCMNPRGQVHENGMGHGDYEPGCTDRTHVTDPVTDYPEIEQQDEAACTADMWEEFLDADSYDHEVDLTRTDGTETKLFYSVVEDDEGKKKVKARLAFDDLLGWLAMGFADPEGGHNGMNGGSVVLAMPGGNYSAATGLDLDVDGSSATYMIHPSMSAFRHWMTPIETDETKTTMSAHEETDCFSALTFESDHINGKMFNLEGSDEMIWAGNSYDHFMGYHKRGNRARFTLDWTTGDVAFFGEEPEEEAVEVETESAGSVKNGIIAMFTSYALASMMQHLIA